MPSNGDRFTQGYERADEPTQDVITVLQLANVRLNNLKHELTGLVKDEDYKDTVAPHINRLDHIENTINKAECYIDELEVELLEGSPKVY